MQSAHRLRFLGKAFLLLGTTALGLAAAPSARAQTHLVDSQTLNGTFFYDPAANVVSIPAAQGFIDTHSPTGTFTATQQVLVHEAYQGGDTSTPQQFLGNDGGSYLATIPGTKANLEDGIFDFKGYLDVTTANTYNFATYSDDGSGLFIDGTEIVNNDGVSSPHYAQGNDTLTAGLHPVELIYYNHVFSGIGGAHFSAGFAGLNVTSVNPFGSSGGPASAAPEPSAIAIWAFVGLGAAGLALKVRRRKVAAA